MLKIFKTAAELPIILQNWELLQALLFVVFPKILLVFLVIGFASRDKVLEKHAVIDDLYMEDEERTEAPDADTIDVVIPDQLLAVGNFIQASRIYN